MFVAVHCRCGKTLRAPASAAGNKARCPDCKAILDIPAAGDDELGLTSKPAPPKRSAFDSDEMPVARRSRRRDDDELDQQQRSTNKGKGGMVVLVVVAVLVVFGCAGLGVGGVVFYLVSKKSDSAASSKDPIASHGVGSVPDYYPLKVGTKWHYRVSANGAETQVSTQISRIEMIDGQSMARLDAQANGALTASEHLTANDKGVFRHRYNGISVQPSLCVLKYPIKEGESWTADYTVGNDKFSVVSTCSREVVSVPAGKYAAVKVTSRTNLNGKDITFVFWFAEGIGLVKEVVDGLGPPTISMELEQVELAK